jgi:hypothetical protein
MVYLEVYGVFGSSIPNLNLFTKEGRGEDTTALL